MKNATEGGIDNRFASIVEKPKLRSVSVKYSSGVKLGTRTSTIRMYSGHRSKSASARRNILSVSIWRLCIIDLDGSSRRSRLTRIFSSRSLNQPLGRRCLRDLVCAIEGMRAYQAQAAMMRMKLLSMRKSLDEKKGKGVSKMGSVSLSAR